MIDEMFPAAAAEILRTKYGHDAVQVGEVGLRAADDTQVAAAGGQAAALARILDRWDRDHPDPYLGHHWPAVG